MLNPEAIRRGEKTKRFGHLRKTKDLSLHGFAVLPGEEIAVLCWMLTRSVKERTITTMGTATLQGLQKQFDEPACRGPKATSW
jgi:hypothetical protein